MFTLSDGREHLYQWDLDRQVAVQDSSITEVHFCNRTDECSLVTKVVNGLADIPNILLQSSFDIRVFGYDGKATRFDKVFKVKARTRPADYIYTETEVLSIEKLEEELRKTIDERLDEIADGITVDLTGYATEEYVDNAIANIEIPEIEPDEEVKRIYYFDFTNIPVSEFGKAHGAQVPEDLSEFLARLNAGEEVIAYIKDASADCVRGWHPAIVDSRPSLKVHVILCANSLLYGTTNRLISGTSNPVYYTYYIDDDILFKSSEDNFVAATEEYVDNAIANIEIPEIPEIPSLDEYVTETEVNELINTALGVIENGSY